MRNMLMVGAASFALLGASQAMAQSAPNASDMSITVAATCTATGVDDITLSVANVAAANSLANQTDAFTLICDDPNGANLTLTSSNVGLQNDQLATEKVGYQAQVTGTGITTATLNTPTAASVLVPQTANADLANNANNDNATLTVDIGTFTFSGVYTDTLTIDIAGI